MRLKTFIAPSPQQAMAALRAGLGEDAIIVASHTLADGQVRITGAIAEQDLDLASVLAPRGVGVEIDLLASIAQFHDLPTSWIGHTDGWQAEDADPVIALRSRLETGYRFAMLPTQSRRPLLFAGPPGSGKTTSVAKVAARMVLSGRKVEVVCADTERAGGAARLDRLLAPLKIEPRPATGAQADLKAAGQGDLVLIDSPGINPFGARDLAALSDLIDRFDADVVLVMAAGTSFAEAAEIGHTFAALGARRLIATRLDATRRLGSILAAADAGLAIADAGIGPSIGNGLHPLGAAGLARLMCCRHQETQGEALSR